MNRIDAVDTPWHWRWIFWSLGAGTAAMVPLILVQHQWAAAVLATIGALAIGSWPYCQRVAEEAGYARAMNSIEDGETLVVPASCPVCGGRLALRCRAHGTVVEAD